MKRVIGRWRWFIRSMCAENALFRCVSGLRSIIFKWINMNLVIVCGLIHDTHAHTHTWQSQNTFDKLTTSFSKFSRSQNQTSNKEEIKVEWWTLNNEVVWALQWIRIVWIKKGVLTIQLWFVNLIPSLSLTTKK